VVQPDIPSVTVDEIGADAFVLDVREPYEWEAGHIAGATHVPMNSIPATVQYEPQRVPADRRVHVVCAVGGRSGQVAAWLAHQGYDAVNVAGGMHAWAAAGRPMVSETGAAPRVA
jgi:rhodanese-related sulfurtransferase